MTTLRQTAALLAGQDLGLLRPPIHEPALSTRIISRDPLVVALPAGHRLARRQRVRLDALADEPFVIYTRSYGPSVQDAILGHCLAAGFAPAWSRRPRTCRPSSRWSPPVSAFRC